MVSSDYVRDIRGIFLISLFMLVVPLFFFPKDFGLRANMPTLLPFIFELGWYVAIFFILFSKVSALGIIFFAFLTLLYRLCLGICFGFFLMAAFPLDLSSSLKLGSYHYLPAFLLQVVMSPFVLKSSFQMLMQKSIWQKEESGPEKKTSPEKPIPFLETQISNTRRDHMKVTSSMEEKKRTRRGDLEEALHYLKEYSGVKGAILVDNEGLVVASDASPDFDPEIFASLAVALKEANHNLLGKINEGKMERMGIHTPQVWISLSEILSFTLVTVAHRHTDELLSVRISQAVGMIKKHLEERYNQRILKGVEE